MPIKIRRYKSGKGYKKDLNEDGFVGENIKETAIRVGKGGRSRTVEKSDLTAEGNPKKVKRVTYAKLKTKKKSSEWKETKQKIVIKPKNGKRKVIRTI